MRFKDKVVTITGGNKGIGRAIALAFAGEGAAIVSGYHGDPDASTETVDMIKKLGAKVEPVQMDVRVKQDCERLVDTAVERFGRLDIAINNAGVSTMNHAVDLTEEEWDLNMDVNAKGVFLCCQAQARQFVKQGDGGRIVNIASMASKRPAALMSHYAASKFAALGFSQSLALELAKHGITVNCVCPGFVKTAMQQREIAWEARLRGMAEQDVREEYVDMTPLGRLEEPGDVAKVTLFLASDDAGFMTGQAVNVTGGIQMSA